MESPTLLRQTSTWDLIQSWTADILDIFVYTQLASVRFEDIVVSKYETFILYKCMQPELGPFCCYLNWPAYEESLIFSFLSATHIHDVQLYVSISDIMDQSLICNMDGLTGKPAKGSTLIHPWVRVCHLVSNLAEHIQRPMYLLSIFPGLQPEALEWL